MAAAGAVAAGAVAAGAVAAGAVAAGAVSGGTNGSEEERSGNSILLIEVDADLGFPAWSVSLPNTATPQSFKTGLSQGSGSTKTSDVSATTSTTVSAELLLSSDGSLEVFGVRFSSLNFSVCSRAYQSLC